MLVGGMLLRAALVTLWSRRNSRRLGWHRVGRGTPNVNVWLVYAGFFVLQASAQSSSGTGSIGINIRRHKEKRRGGGQKKHQRHQPWSPVHLVQFSVL